MRLLQSRPSACAPPPFLSQTHWQDIHAPMSRGSSALSRNASPIPRPRPQQRPAEVGTLTDSPLSAHPKKGAATGGRSPDTGRSQQAASGTRTFNADAAREEAGVEEWRVTC